jgi:uncharacterized protein YdaU (DUF1376 family)
MYPADYSIDTQALTYEQHGLYKLILDQLWLRDSLPDDPKKIAEILGKDPRPTTRIYNEISHYFHLNNGNITHKKIDKLKREAEEISKSRKDAADKRWKANQ